MAVSKAPTPAMSSYTSLDTKQHEIRLVHLHPYTAGKDITCHIETVNLDTRPFYEALSYEWGPPDSERLPITVQSTTILVRQNLWWAMQHLRQKYETRTLWIDAICINQENTHERNHQVGQMKRIYSEALRVVAWIGRESIVLGIDLFSYLRWRVSWGLGVAAHRSFAYLRDVLLPSFVFCLVLVFGLHIGIKRSSIWSRGVRSRAGIVGRQFSRGGVIYTSSVFEDLGYRIA